MKDAVLASIVTAIELALLIWIGSMVLQTVSGDSSRADFDDIVYGRAAPAVRRGRFKVIEGGKKDERPA